ncbi:MAG: hypothetical protein QM647_08860 [Asticcacaulis sp.]|uniref:hypothetical protein n=1 Tax=Asticcacaulis sp. TaxID=1872648 RepID=UPI0039E3BE77
MLREMFEAFEAAIGDIRQKLVEEAWFGRTVTERPADAPPVVTGWDMPRADFEAQWGMDRQGGNDPAPGELEGMDHGR